MVFIIGKLFCLFILKLKKKGNKNMIIFLFNCIFICFFLNLNVESIIEVIYNIFIENFSLYF